MILVQLTSCWSACEGTWRKSRNAERFLPDIVFVYIVIYILIQSELLTHQCSHYISKFDVLSFLCEKCVRHEGEARRKEANMKSVCERKEEERDPQRLLD